MGGYRWSAYSVGWGQKGRNPTKEMLGYHAKKKGKGAISAEYRNKLTVNVWQVDAVYALHRDNQLVYVGEGNLGNRLLAHWRTDMLAGKWDTFSWVSPWWVENPEDDGSSEAKLLFSSEEDPVPFNAKTLGEVLEMVLIRLAEPPANSQVPRMSNQMAWLTQVESRYADLTIHRATSLLPELRDMLARVEAKLKQD